MLALAKAKVGHIRQVPPVRPIGVGSSMTRLMGGGVVTAFLGIAKRLLCPIQVAVGVKGSADKLVFGMRALVKMKAGEQAGLRKLDVCNAFQEFDRSDVMRLIAAKEGDAAYVRQVEAWGEEQVRQLQAMLPVVWAMLSVAPELVKEGGESAGFHSEVGGTQGFPPTPIFFCIALHPHLRAAEKRLKEHADWSVVRAQMDDAYLAGPVSALDEVEERLRADLVEAGLRLDRAKWLTYAEPAVRFTVTHTRNAQGLEPWAWGASVQRGGSNLVRISGRAGGGGGR